jgi:hypothetical protein
VTSPTRCLFEKQPSCASIKRPLRLRLQSACRPSVATRKRFNTGCLFPLLECHQKLISLIRSSCSSQARATPEPLRYFYPAESALRLHLPPLPRLSARHCRQGRLVCSASAERKVCWTASFDRTRLSGLNGIYTASLLLGLVKLSICAEPTAPVRVAFLFSDYTSDIQEANNDI